MNDRTPDKICPLMSGPVYTSTGHKLFTVKCRGHDCMFYSMTRGQHPQTGEQMEQWDCSINLQMLIGLESARAGHRNADATNQFRNEFVDRSDKQIKLQAAIAVGTGLLEHRDGGV